MGINWHHQQVGEWRLAVESISRFVLLRFLPATLFAFFYPSPDIQPIMTTPPSELITVSPHFDFADADFEIISNEFVLVSAMVALVADGL